MIVVYIAGPYRAPTWGEVVENIERVEGAAIDVTRLGVAWIGPHLMTPAVEQSVTGDVADSYWLEMTKELLRRCDCVLVVGDYSKSEGTKGEIAEAATRGMPVFYSLSDLDVWLRTCPVDGSSEPAGMPEW